MSHACAPIFVGMTSPVLEIILPLKNGQISLSTIKNLINRNQLKKFMHVSIDELCMCINFGGRDLSGFGDIITSQKWPNFPFDPWTIVHGHQKI